MKNIVKYGLVPLVVGIFLLLVTLTLLPALLNVQKFLPQIEQQLTHYTGRPFRVGSDFGLTFFPWLSLTFSDMHLGNPEGFDDEDFLRVDSFEARLKILPLLANRLVVSRFVVSGLHVKLVRDENGRANWHLFGEEGNGKKEEKLFSHLNLLAGRDLYIDLFAVTGGGVTFEDKLAGDHHDVHDLMLVLNNVSPEAKARTEVKAVMNGHQFKGNGFVGPFVSLNESLPLAINFSIDEWLQIATTGKCAFSTDIPNCNLKVSAPKITLQNMVKEEVSDGGLTQILALQGEFAGNISAFTVTSGKGSIDDSPFDFSLEHTSSQDPENSVLLQFKSLDLDKYFANNFDADAANTSTSSWPVLEILKKNSFKSQVSGEEIKVAGVLLQDVAASAKGGKEFLEIRDGSFTLHGGKGTIDGRFGLNHTPVKIESSVKVSGMRADSLTQELTGAPFLRGSLDARCKIERFPDKKSQFDNGFSGKSSVIMTKGSIEGLDLLAEDSVGDGGNTQFDRLKAELLLGEGIIGINSLIISSGEKEVTMNGAVQFNDNSFTLTPDNDNEAVESLSLAGSYGPDGLIVDGFTDVHETKLYEMRDVQTLVDEKMPAPVEEDVTDVEGTPLIDPAIVARRFGLKPDQIKPEKLKKAHNVGRGRIIIHDLKQSDVSILTN